MVKWNKMEYGTVEITNSKDKWKHNQILDYIIATNNRLHSNFSLNSVFLFSLYIITFIR